VAYLSASSSTLDVTLKAAVKLWVGAQVGVNVVSVGNVTETASISASVGASVAAVVDANGIVAASVIASLKAWLDVQVNLDATIKAALDVFFNAKAVATLDVDVVLSLSEWLIGSDCTLDPQLKAILLFWLHGRVTADIPTAVLASTDIATLSAWIKGGVAAELSVTVQSAIALAISAEAAIYTSADAIAELAAIIAGLVDVQIPANIELILVKWLTGSSSSATTKPIASILPSVLPASILPTPTASLLPVSILPTPTPSLLPASILPIPSASLKALSLPTSSEIVKLPTSSEIVKLPTSSGIVKLPKPTPTAVFPAAVSPIADSPAVVSPAADPATADSWGTCQH
jgi:hypothetical protein